ncbi:hypothetical protein Peur_023938 [Populus x canadensis]
MLASKLANLRSMCLTTKLHFRTSKIRCRFITIELNSTFILTSREQWVLEQF